MYNKRRNIRGQRPTSYYGNRTGGAGSSMKIKSRQGMHPALKAALFMMIPIIVIQVLIAYAFDFSPIYIYPAQLICYLLSGVLAARFFAESINYVRPRNLRDQCVKLGATAGITLGIIDLLLSILFTLIIKDTTWANSFEATTTVTFAIFTPIDILFGLLLGALGGKLYDNSWR